MIYFEENLDGMTFYNTSVQSSNLCTIAKVEEKYYISWKGNKGTKYSIEYMLGELNKGNWTPQNINQNYEIF